VLQDASEEPAPTGEAGRLVSTSLLNVDMPFVRYVIGDRGRLAQAEERCDCGRTLPLLAGLEGRTNDLLLTRDGRRVFWLNPVFYGLPIREAQLVQETLDTLCVNYVPAPGFDQTSARTLTERLRMRLGDIAVELNELDEVPRNLNGKFQAVVCRINTG
jgi:phenylacetate-CoA ligase